MVPWQATQSNVPVKVMPRIARKRQVKSIYFTVTGLDLLTKYGILCHRCLVVSILGSEIYKALSNLRFFPRRASMRIKKWNW